MSLNKRMSVVHEHAIAERLGMRVQPGSGNQWNKQGDVVGNRFKDRFAFTFDCKATRGASIGVSVPMWDKIEEQAGGNRPGLALRWYGDDRLSIVKRDLIVISLDDFEELLEGAHAGDGDG